RVIFQARTPGQPIDVGTKTGLGLTNAELGLVTAGVLQVGSASAGNVNVSAAIIAPATFNTLTLIGSGVTETGSLSVTNLRIGANGAAVLNGNNAVVMLAAAASNGLSFTDTIGLTVGTVDTVAVITTVPGPVTLVTDASTS